MKRTIISVLLLVMVLLPVARAEQPAPTYEDRYWRIDTKSSSELPSRFRTMDVAFPEDAEAPLPTRDGMEQMRISGSGQYSTAQFRAMIEEIRAMTDSEICIFDLRQETHGFANGTAVSLYAQGNQGNLGLDVDQVTETEHQQLASLQNTQVTFGNGSSGKDRSGKDKPEKQSDESRKSDKKKDETPTVLSVNEVLTEEELCAGMGVRYVRIACTDHLCPKDTDVDTFMEAYQALPEGTWCHFHCAAGVGRTGLFMMMADKLRCPEVPMEEIIRRQVLLGANDPYSDKGSEGEQSGEKVDLLFRFERYVEALYAGETDLPFSQWTVQ